MTTTLFAAIVALVALFGVLAAISAIQYIKRKREIDEYEDDWICTCDCDDLAYSVIAKMPAALVSACALCGGAVRFVQQQGVGKHPVKQCELCRQEWKCPCHLAYGHQKLPGGDIDTMIAVSKKMASDPKSQAEDYMMRRSYLLSFVPGNTDQRDVEYTDLEDIFGPFPPEEEEEPMPIAIHYCPFCGSSRIDHLISRPGGEIAYCVSCNADFPNEKEPVAIIANEICRTHQGCRIAVYAHGNTATQQRKNFVARLLRASSNLVEPLTYKEIVQLCKYNFGRGITKATLEKARAIADQRDW